MIRPILPKAVIFDVGRVIVRLNLHRALEPLARAQTAPRTRATAKLVPEQLWAAIQADPRWQDWQEGRITPLEWHQYLTARLGMSLAFEEFCAAWNRALDPDTILEEGLFARLGAQYRLALLSNTDPLHAACLDRQFLFGRHFSARIYSCCIGASKPSPAIYQAALDALGITAPEALYIDDIAEYAEAARQLGLDAIRFENPAQLLGELSRRGLISA